MSSCQVSIVRKTSFALHSQVLQGVCCKAKLVVQDVVRMEFYDNC